MLMWFQIALEDKLMAVWNQWKYPLILSLFFLLIYGFIGILYPTPSVNLPEDIHLLLNDRRRLQLPAVIDTNIPAFVEQNVQAVVASELWDPVNGANNVIEGIRRRRLDSRNRDIELIQNKRNTSKTWDEGRVSDDESNSSFTDNSREIGREKIFTWLERREIIGNERFVNRFQSGIQKPEDFYERNRDTVVKIQTGEHTSTVTKTESSGASDLNTGRTKTNKSDASSFLLLTTAPTFSATGKHQKSQEYTDIRNDTSSENLKLSNSSSDIGHVIQKGLRIDATSYRDDVFRELGRKPESTSSHVQPIKGSRHDDIRYRNPVRRRRIRRKSRINGTTVADLESTPYPPMIVKSTGAFLDRVRSYNAAIAAVSAEILKRRGYGAWRDVADPEHLNVVWGNTDDFLERLSEHVAARTILLPWMEHSRSEWSSLTDRSNVLVNKYYAWSSTPPLCAWIQTPGFTKARWDAVYDRECSEDMSAAARPRSLEFMYFYAKPINVNHYWPNYGTAYPAYFYTRPPPHVFYVHLLQDAVVNTVGDVISGDLKLVPYTCSHDNLPTVPAEYPQRPVYRELFVMTQYWGTSFFHKIVEVMPRVAPYVDLLRANPTIQIHAPEDRSQVSEMLQMLGIDPVRVVTGVTRAKLAYLPQGTPCGFPDARSIQLLSKLLREHVRSRRQAPRNRLVYVRRSGLRRFAVDAPIEFVLRAVAERHRLNFTVFGDRPTPPLSSAAELFNSAVAVVGPHGAGLSNVVFCEPGTALVEGVCNEPHVNMCYQMTAHMLGLRYHAIPSRGGCERVVDITASDVETSVETYVRMVLADMRRYPQQ